MTTEENKHQDKSIEQLWRQLDKKVPWLIFAFAMVVVLGLFTYLATADGALGGRGENIYSRIK